MILRVQQNPKHLPCSELFVSDPFFPFLRGSLAIKESEIPFGVSEKKRSGNLVGGFNPVEKY